MSGSEGGVRVGSLILITGRITISIEVVSAILRLIVHSITISIKDLHTAAIYIYIYIDYILCIVVSKGFPNNILTLIIRLLCDDANYSILHTRFHIFFSFFFLFFSFSHLRNNCPRSIKFETVWRTLIRNGYKEVSRLLFIVQEITKQIDIPEISRLSSLLCKYLNERISLTYVCVYAYEYVCETFPL